MRMSNVRKIKIDTCESTINLSKQMRGGDSVRDAMLTYDGGGCVLLLNGMLQNQNHIRLASPAKYHRKRWIIERYSHNKNEKSFNLRSFSSLGELIKEILLIFCLIRLLEALSDSSSM